GSSALERVPLSQPITNRRNRGSMTTQEYNTSFPTLKGKIGDLEWEERCRLAACYRLMDRYGMADLIYNHITAQIPDKEDRLLINLYGLLYTEITASSLVEIDLEGNVIN